MWVASTLRALQRLGFGSCSILAFLRYAQLNQQVNHLIPGNRLPLPTLNLPDNIFHGKSHNTSLLIV
jgi:hypothetical protein